MAVRAGEARTEIGMRHITLSLAYLLFAALSAMFYERMKSEDRILKLDEIDRFPVPARDRA